MIEEVTKGIRRGKTVDGDFISKLYSDMTTSYHLDEVERQEAKNLGPLPTGSVVLIVSLGVIWIGILSAFVVMRIKNRKKPLETIDKR